MQLVITGSEEGSFIVDLSYKAEDWKPVTIMGFSFNSWVSNLRNNWTDSPIAQLKEGAD